MGGDKLGARPRGEAAPLLRRPEVGQSFLANWMMNSLSLSSGMGAPII